MSNLRQNYLERIGFMEEQAQVALRDLIQNQPLIAIDVSAQGYFNNAKWFTLDQPCNGGVFLRSAFYGGGDPSPADNPTNLLSSSSNALVFIQFNDEHNPWLPFSLNQGTVYFNAWAGVVWRFRAYVFTADAVTTKMYLMPVMSFSLFSPNGAQVSTYAVGAGYAPIVTAQQQQSSSTTSSSQRLASSGGGIQTTSPTLRGGSSA